MNAFVASLPTSFAGPAASPACAAITPSSHAGFRQCAVPARMHHMPVMRSHCATALSPSPSSSSSPSFFSSAAFGTAVPQQTQQLQQQQQQELPELQSQPHQPNTPTTRVQPRMDVTVVVGENEPVESGTFYTHAFIFHNTSPLSPINKCKKGKERN